MFLHNRIQDWITQKLIKYLLKEWAYQERKRTGNL
jgi:hypothetical protein